MYISWKIFLIEGIGKTLLNGVALFNFCIIFVSMYKIIANTIMKTLFAFFLLLVTCNSVMGTIPAIPADVHNHQLYYTAPATIWEETLPLGNGRLGMMPDGGVDREHIVLNEISLWSGMEADYGNPDASRSLPAI